MAKNLTTPERKAPRQQLDIRAQWCADLLVRHPSLLRAGVVQAEIRKHFGCGITMAKNIHHRALEIMLETIDKPRIQALFAQQRIADIETARSRGDLRTAEVVRANFEKQIGLGPTDKLELTIHDKDDPDLSDWTEDEMKKLLAVKPKAASAK